MVAESLIATIILFIGATFAFGVGLRGWGLLPIGYILGQSAMILFGAVQLFLRLPTTPRIPIVVLLLVSVAYWVLYFIKRKTNITQVVKCVLALFAVFIVVSGIYSISETRTFLYHVDSIEYLLIGAQLESNTLDREMNHFQTQKRMIGVPLLHSPANVFSELFLFTVTPLIALSSVGILVWVWQKGLQDRIKDKKALWVVLLFGAAALVTNERFIMHSFYVNGHLFFAALLCLCVGTAWLMAEKKQLSTRSFLLVQAMAMPAMIFTRPEAFLILGLVLVSILSSRSFTYMQKAGLLTIFGVSVILWHTFLAYLRFRHDVEIPSSVYGPIILGVASLVVIYVLRTKIYESIQQYLPNLIEGILWLILGLFILASPQELGTSIGASVQNIVHYWGIVAWVIPVSLFIVTLLLFKFPHQQILRFPITTFLPLMLLLIYIREGAYRFGNGDSLNRMWMQIIPLIVMYAVLSFVLGKWRFSRR